MEATQARAVTHGSGWRGFTLIELLLVVAVVGILAGLSVWGFQNLKTSINQRTYVGDTVAALTAGKMRALARQRTVVFVFDHTNLSAPTYYQLDDLSPTQTMANAANLMVVAATFTRSAANYGLDPATFSARLVGDGSGQLPVVAQAQAWGAGTPFPFPFRATSVDTQGGCTFCAGGRGALAFLPDSRVLFSSNAAGRLMSGALVFGRGDGTSGSLQNMNKAVMVSMSGHVELINQ